MSENKTFDKSNFDPKAAAEARKAEMEEIGKKLEQGVKDFHVKDNCISCGKCERLCPLQVISMDNGKPVWKGKTCAHCMSCIQNCPAAAIEYGKKTKGKKHYYFEKYRYALNK